VQIYGGSAETTLLAQGCGEYIHFAGTVQQVFTVLVTPTNRRLLDIRFVYANFTGIGETSGTTYRLVSIEGGVTSAVSDDQETASTFEVTYKIFGGGQIYTVKGLGHVTWLPSGEIVVRFGDLSFGCSP
jgi:hypothetical protein